MESDGFTEATRDTGRLIFAPGTPEDYPQIEALLAETGLPGPVPLRIRPVLSAGPAHPDAISHSVVGRDGDTLVACACCTTYPTAQGPIAWIGGVRVARSFSGTAGLTREGLGAIRAHLLGGPPDWQLAAVFGKGLPRHGFLSRRSDTLPRFEPLIDYAVLALRPSRRDEASVRRATEDDRVGIAGLLAAEDRPLAVRFDVNERFDGRRNLSLEDFLVTEQQGRVTGAVAVWDQSAARQVTLAPDTPALRTIRPLLNLAAPLRGQPRLPGPGQPLRYAVLSFLVAPDTETALTLLRGGLAEVGRRGLDMAAIGLALDDPLCDAVVQKMRPQRYGCTIYGVTWPGGRALPRPAFFAQSKVELALL